MSRVLFSLAISVLLQFFPIYAEAKQDFFDQRYRGWLWFDQSRLYNEKEKEQEIQNRQPSLPTIVQMHQAKKENEEFAKELELLKHLAIRYPDNLEYIKLYKLKEKEMTDRAATLGTNWLMVNFLNPEIIDELKHPQNIYGRGILQNEKSKYSKEILTELSKKIEIFVFRQEGCPYCSILEKHLKTFATKYGFQVEAITPDMSQSSYFKTNSSPELIAALGLEVMPTVIAVVNDSRKRFELARGAVSVVDLEEKAVLLAEHLAKQSLQIEEELNEKQSKYMGDRKW